MSPLVDFTDLAPRFKIVEQFSILARSLREHWNRMCSQNDQKENRPFKNNILMVSRKTKPSPRNCLFRQVHLFRSLPRIMVHPRSAQHQSRTSIPPARRPTHRTFVPRNYSHGFFRCTFRRFEARQRSRIPTRARIPNTQFSTAYTPDRDFAASNLNMDRTPFAPRPPRHVRRNGINSGLSKSNPSPTVGCGSKPVLT